MAKKRRKKLSPKISEDEGLTVSYDKTNLKEKFPKLIHEISKNEKSISIESFEIGAERKRDKTEESDDYIPKELIDPGAVDFIRRCQTKEEALEIIEFLYKNKKIPQPEYDELHKALNMEGGLEALIKSSGGFKEPGYYLRKYYKKDFNH